MFYRETKELERCSHSGNECVGGQKKREYKHGDLRLKEVVELKIQKKLGSILKKRAIYGSSRSIRART